MAKFDPEVLGEIVKECIGVPHDEMLAAITDAVEKRYPKLYIRKKRKWSWRTAAGIPSRGYVSGLAIAHCVFSGRQAGRHAAAKVG